MRKYLYVLIIFVSSIAAANEVGMLEFIDRPVSEILFVLSDESGIHMLPDETVSGTSSFYFAGGNIDSAVNLFLEQNHLYKNEKDSWTQISRVRVESRGSLISIDAYKVSLAGVLRKLSQDTRQTILFDPIPEIPVTIHLEQKSPDQVLRILIESIPDHSLEFRNGVFFIKRNKTLEAYNQELYFLGTVSHNDGFYHADIQKGQLSEAIKRLFSLNAREYVLLSDRQVYIQNIRYDRKSFNDLLSLILEQSGMRFVHNEDIYYILDADRESIIQKFKTQLKIEYKNRSVAGIRELIPRELIPEGRITLDELNNSVILYGTPEQILPVQEFLSALDQELSGWIHKRYDLDYLAVDRLSSLLPDHLSMVRIKAVESGRVMIAFMPEESLEAFDLFLEQIDKAPPSHAVHLRYIKAGKFLESLPPGFSASDFIPADDDSLVFFQGNSGKYDELISALKSIDVPVPQIRYDLLVIQYQESKKFNWDINYANSILDSGDQKAYLGNLGSVASLSFDTTSAFGYMFSLKLNSDISQSRARVMADTTLNGLTNQEVSLQNTNTFRYRDTVKDPENGTEEVTGVSREITSGLFIKIKGWVSGNDMITMDVSTTVSRQEDLNDNDLVGILPPTAEKVVNTHVRSPAGKPVVIGGLIQNEKAQAIQRVPLLGHIPLLGFLFQKRVEIMENTEMVIYIVPHLEFENKVIPEDVIVRSLYEKYSQYLP